jgi:hypothetical protein
LQAFLAFPHPNSLESINLFCFWTHVLHKTDPNEQIFRDSTIRLKYDVLVKNSFSIQVDPTVTKGIQQLSITDLRQIFLKSDSYLCCTIKNLLDSSSGPKMINSSSNSMQHEAVLSAILLVHINALSAVKFA